MARRKTISDTDLCAMVLNAFVAGGERAISFRLIAEATGLAPATLVGRFATYDGMLHAAIAYAWDQQAQAIETARRAQGKGPQAFLKELTAPHPAVIVASLRERDLLQHFTDWRAEVEQELADRMNDKDAAALAFAAWFGRHMLLPAGGKGFRLGELVKKLSG